MKNLFGICVAALLLGGAISFVAVQRSNAADAPQSEGAANGLAGKVIDWQATDLQGKAVSSKDLRGQVVVLDFWATWCGPCKAEIPNFVSLQQQYGAQGLVVLGVSVDDTVDKLQPFAKELRMNYPVLVGLGRNDVQDAFGPLWGIPTTFLIGRDGRICRKNTGVQGRDKYERDIKALL